MSDIQAIKMASKILKVAKELKFFTFDQLEAELSSIPESTLKTQCIEWLLISPEVEQILGIYHFLD